MADPISVRPTLPGGAGGPDPFNSNDVLVWKALICKYICKNDIETFSKTNFYEALLNGEFPQGRAYVEPLLKATQDERKLFDNLLYYSLDSLSKNGLLKRYVKTPTDIEYRKTSRLNIFCRDILKYDMLDVDAIVKPVIIAEDEIRSDENFLAIITLLNNLKEPKRTDIGEASQNIDIPTIHKLNQLGTIFVTLSGDLSISPIGRKVISELSQERSSSSL
jgi:hypothetical protein